MATNKFISVSELDFDAIKANLKTYLQGQEQFQDYDFEGSGMAILLDILAYNTHYNALYTNLAVNEMFLDSARKRNSVVSLAKSLGYLPNSATSSRAVINLNVSNPLGLPATLTLPEKTPFQTEIDNKTYTFYNLESKTISPINGVYRFEQVSIYEGTPLVFNYEYKTGNRYILPNKNVDISKLKVRVLEDPILGKYYTYTFAQYLTDVTNTTRVFYLKEIDDELFEVEFGDGVLGKEPPTGSKIILEYFVTAKAAANGASSFTFSGNSSDVGNGIPTVTVLSSADGGADIESIDSIKTNAPRLFSAQQRTITSEDYSSIITKLYPNVQSISVWGGENNVPPAYGKVFIAIKPISGDILSALTKQYIVDLLKQRNTVSITPVIVDPTILYIEIKTTVYYDATRTASDPNTLVTNVKETITEYNAEELKKFGGIFRFSKLGGLIDDTDEAILSNITSIKLRRDIYPIGDANPHKYTVRLDNPIYRDPESGNHIITSGFKLFGRTETFYLVDDGNKNLGLFYYESSGTVKVFINETAGTVDYENGVIVVNNIAIVSTQKVSFFVTPVSNDVVSVRDQLVQIDEEKISVNAIVDKVVSGTQGAGSSEYIFTASRE